MCNYKVVSESTRCFGILMTPKESRKARGGVFLIFLLSLEVKLPEQSEG